MFPALLSKNENSQTLLAGRSRFFWAGGTLLIALPVVLPVTVILLALLFGDRSISLHLIDTVLPRYTANTVLLMAGVAILTIPIGVVTAWLTSTYRFPGSSWLPVALVLPLAAPSYVVGYVYADLLDYTGPLQTWLRDWGWNLGLPPIRSLPGAACVIAFVLYPYIFLLTRVSFRQQSVALTEAARTLGASPLETFVRVALPLARPAVIGGLALVLMETVADYGVVAHYGVPTFTTGIFRTWFAMGQPQAALQLAGCLFLIAAVLLIVAGSFGSGFFSTLTGSGSGCSSSS